MSLYQEIKLRINYKNNFITIRNFNSRIINIMKYDSKYNLYAEHDNYKLSVL